MKIIYNPKDGAPINKFIFNHEEFPPHYQDGFEISEKEVSNGLVQYQDPVADYLIETYGFLQLKTPDEAKLIVDRPVEQKYSCDFPGCDFKTSFKIGLSGHKKSHKKEAEQFSKPLVSTDIIPVAGGKKIITLEEKEKMNDNKSSDIVNGSDKDGVSWYGDGVTVENRVQDNFSAVRPEGKGHFVG